MHDRLTRLLVCPNCHSSLEWTVLRRSTSEILEGSARCDRCGVDFPIRHGIPALMVGGRSPTDLWEEAGTGIHSFVQNEPERARALLEAADDHLNPSDLWLRGLVLEARQEYGRADPLMDYAWERLYTTETREASQSQMDYVCARVKRRRGPVVDLATGRGYLLERLLRSTRRHILATDLSPRVLRRDLDRLRTLGRGSRVDALAFDAIRTPFADGSLTTLTTNLGWMNVAHPASLLEELRRIVSGEVLGITAFYPEEAGRNSETIHRLGLELLYYRETALSAFERAGFSVVIANARKARAVPTPESRFLAGFQPDLLPIEETELEWCTVVAR
jgi:uncharacterized protein YbaR (Trm112 family)/ubiquinone/menaquinone biosynthesis C-methylase UbiE